MLGKEDPSGDGNPDHFFWCWPPGFSTVLLGFSLSLCLLETSHKVQPISSNSLRENTKNLFSYVKTTTVIDKHGKTLPSTHLVFLSEAPQQQLLLWCSNDAFLVSSYWEFFCRQVCPFYPIYLYNHISADSWIFYSLRLTQYYRS